MGAVWGLLAPLDALLNLDGWPTAHPQPSTFQQRVYWGQGLGNVSPALFGASPEPVHDGHGGVNIQAGGSHGPPGRTGPSC